MRLRLAIILTLLAAPAFAQQADPPPATQPPPAPRQTVAQPQQEGFPSPDAIILDLRRKCEAVEYTSSLYRLRSEALAEALKKLREAGK